ncbi:MAG: HD domain-containing protein [Candidatus Gastranaerophilaceae bacterium]
MNNNELEKIYNECIKYSNKIKNPILREIVQKIYNDYKEKLMNKPATQGSHHYFKGGLLYHIYSVTKNAIAICNLYPKLEVDMDLVIFGALTHDIGKTNDFNNFVEAEDYNPKTGNSFALLGHSYEGTHIVETYLSNYDIDEQFKNQVLHMIGSHMKEYSEWGALVLPKMLEVIIINYADSMDAYFEPAHDIIKNANPGELYKVGNAPRPYYKSLNTYYNKSEDNENQIKQKPIKEV